MTATQTSSATGRKQRGRMAADRQDPWVAVSTMKEKMFCDRAAIIASKKVQDDGEDGMMVLGQYRVVPLYTLRAIRRALRGRALWLLGCVALALAGTWVAAAPQALLVRLAGFVAAGTSVLKGLHTAFQILQLLLQYGRAQIAASRVPDVEKDEIQDVYWWGLIANGYEARQPQEALSDEKWRLIGKPWRVLYKHGQRIPVVRVRMDQPRLMRQHFARIAAYCHLLERNEPGISSPGGVVLLEKYDGKYVPANARSGSTFHNALLDTRRLLRDFTEGAVPARPDPKRCYGCPFGRPTSSNWGASYHSDCGDEFDWVPPHRRAHEKSLV